MQIVYTWKLLEPAKDRYDFTPIERDLATVRAFKKRLFVQVQDRFFSPEARNVPAYLLTDPAYKGGLLAQRDNPGEGLPQVGGWVAMQWLPNVRLRFQSLLKSLATRFDGEIYGINLPETAIDIEPKPPSAGFSCDAYYDAEVSNIVCLRHAFRKSLVVQYVNFWPCEWNNDHNYIGRFFELAIETGIGLGGPDIVPNQKAQMANSYPFFMKYKGKLNIVAMAVQEPTLTYLNPRTKRRFSKQEFVSFARDSLGVDVIFWSTATPWLSRN